MLVTLDLDPGGGRTLAVTPSRRQRGGVSNEHRGVRQSFAAVASALRLYDELGLLEPARVDDQSGYRYYTASQLHRAWLIAGLRQLQIPLAEIIWLNATTGVPIQEKDGSDSATRFEVERVTAARLPSHISPAARLR